MSFGVKPLSRTIAAAALTPSTCDSCCVNAGSGAARVVVEDVRLLVGVVCVCVVGVLVVFAVSGRVCVAVDSVSGGAPAFVTVLVPEPHAASSAIALAHDAASA